jgi:hypothetical protein
MINKIMIRNKQHQLSISLNQDQDCKGSYLWYE